MPLWMVNVASPYLWICREMKTIPSAMVSANPSLSCVCRTFPRPSARPGHSRVGAEQDQGVERRNALGVDQVMTVSAAPRTHLMTMYRNSNWLAQSGKTPRLEIISN